VSSCERLNLEHTSHPDALRNGDRKEFPVYRQSADLLRVLAGESVPVRVPFLNCLRTCSLHAMKANDWTMPKQIDLAKQRRDQGRSLTSAVSELKAMMEPVAQQAGINLRAILDEASARKEEDKQLLTERLQESVVPLFIYRDGQPDRIGSCVLIRLDSEFYAFTAAHVIRDAGSAKFFAPSEGKGGKLQPLPPCTAHLKSSGGNNDLDVGVLALPGRRLGAFQHHVFLAGAEIDQEDLPDDQNDLRSFYFVLGYSASRTQVKVSSRLRKN
jgi:hypothetical protein